MFTYDSYRINDHLVLENEKHTIKKDKYANVYNLTTLFNPPPIPSGQIKKKREKGTQNRKITTHHV